MSNQDFATTVPIQKSETIVLYHNKTIEIRSKELEGQPFTLKIFDLNGRLMEREQINSGSHTYDVGHLNGGIYLIHLSRHNWKSIHKISIL